MSSESTSTITEEEKTIEDESDTPDEDAPVEPVVPPRVPTPPKKDELESSEEEDFEIPAMAVYVDDK
jgi:hypothetical protein